MSVAKSWLAALCFLTLLQASCHPVVNPLRLASRNVKHSMFVWRL